MNRKSNIFLLVSLLFIPIESLFALDQLYIKGQPPVKAEDFRVDGKNIKVKKTIGDATSEIAVPIKDVERMDWSEPAELTEAKELLASGKSKDALKKLDEALEFFEPFKKIPGNWYNQIMLTKLEAEDRAEDVQKTQMLIRELEGLDLDEVAKFKIKLVKLNMDRRTSSSSEEIAARAEALMKETNDSSIQASLWLTIGETKFKKKEWEDALMAYLHVPVFYGTQKALLPKAELSIAQCFSKMQRFHEASEAYGRIMENYKGSEAAETAKTEKEAVDKADKAPTPPQ